MNSEVSIDEVIATLSQCPKRFLPDLVKTVFDIEIKSKRNKEQMLDDIKLCLEGAKDD